MRTYPLILPDGSTVYVQVAASSSDEDVGLSSHMFDEFSALVRTIASSLHDQLAMAIPAKTSIEFGLSLKLESGKLAAIIVQGAGEANLKVGFEWEHRTKT